MTGLASYVAAFLACLAGWRFRERRGVAERVFPLLAGVQLALALDIAFDWRWKLHNFWMERAMAQGLYGERRSPQLLVLLALVGLLGFGCWWIWREFGWRRGVAVMGTVLGAGLWCCETLSYHYMDLALYRMVGPVMVVALLWAGLAVATCAGVWLDVFSG